MTEPDRPAPEPASAGGTGPAAPGGAAAARSSDLSRRLVRVLVAIAVVVLGLLFVTQFLPRWWAHRIANQVDGSYTSGIVAGLFIGVLFTVAPLVLARFAARRHVTWKHRGLLGLAAVVVATPNLLTLGIVLGRGRAARDARTILVNRGTGFRGASLIGAVLGALLFAAGLYLLTTRRSRRREIDQLRGELRKRDTPAAPGGPT